MVVVDRGRLVRINPRESSVPLRDDVGLPLGALEGAEEAFLTSTVREVLPLVQVGERPVGAGTPGPLTRRLHAAFRKRAGGGTGSGGDALPG